MSAHTGIVAGAAAGAFTLIGAAHGSTGGSTDYAPILVGGLISGFFALLVAVISVFGKEIADRMLQRDDPVKATHDDANDALVAALADEHADAQRLRRQVEQMGGTPDA